eukprot:3951633-Pleurochrysis_carterae.AAC.1
MERERSEIKTHVLGLQILADRRTVEKVELEKEEQQYVEEAHAAEQDVPARPRSERLALDSKREARAQVSFAHKAQRFDAQAKRVHASKESLASACVRRRARCAR